MFKLNVRRTPMLWRDPRHRQGLAGELAAARYLESEGWSVLAHRFRFGHHDIDLIARRAGIVAFIEVKSRQSTGFGNGAESVGWQKRAVLRLVAAVWIARRAGGIDRYRFDVILVSWPRGHGFPHVTHIEDAWRDG